MHPVERKRGNLLCAQVVFVGFDHLLNHLTADGTGFAAGELTVVALVELYTNLP